MAHANLQLQDILASIQFASTFFYTVFDYRVPESIKNAKDYVFFG